MKIYIDGHSLNSFTPQVEEGFIQGETALAHFTMYLSTLTGELFAKDGARKIRFEKSDETDGFEIVAKGEEILLRGGKRGVIYAAFALLEKIGCRFLTPDVEVLPKEDVKLDPFTLHENTPFYFRDICGNSGTEKTWSLKHRLTSHLWGRRLFTEAEGGGYEYAGPHIAICHSLTGDALLSDCVETHPEYFALKDGIRRTDRLGQICMTNEDAWQAAAKKAVEYLETSPGKPVVSVSQGDNNNFCECENCKKLVEKQGLPKTYFDVVNKIAAKIQESHPEAIVHTLGYESMEKGLPEGYKLTSNIMIQYCESLCTNHSIVSPTCERNKVVLQRVKRWTDLCNNVWIWSYVNCFKYELFNFPDLFYYREKFKLYADMGIKGIFCEAEHYESEHTEFVGMHELKNYLLCKVMGNPYMSEEEYRAHLVDFCKGYYGDGYENVIGYLELMRDCSQNTHHNYDCFVFGENCELKKPIEVSRVVDKDKTQYYIDRANELITKAETLADSQQKLRLDKIRTEILYYDLFWNMRDILDNGSEEEKEQVLAKNAELIHRIFRQRLKITFWGTYKRVQNEKLIKCFAIPPSEWDYAW